jgi:hypothetical protein
MSLETDKFAEYFANAGKFRTALEELDKVIRTNAPGLKPKAFKNNMGGSSDPGYGMMPYQSSAMKQPGEWPLVSLAAQKNYISLYICAIIDGKYIAEIFKDRLGKVSIGKSCIRFKNIDNLNLETLKEILIELNKRYTAGEHLFP